MRQHPYGYAPSEAEEEYKLQDPTKKAWVLYQMMGSDRCEIGVFIGTGREAVKKSDDLTKDQAKKLYESKGGDAKVILAWKDQALSLGLTESDLVGKRPPQRLFEEALSKAWTEVPSIRCDSLPLL